MRSGEPRADAARLRRAGRSRAGFTLVEMIIAIMIYGIVLAAGIGFVAMQNTLFHRGLDRMTALQNVRYAISSLETDIPSLGTNVPGSQPSLVYADSMVLAFTADYASNVENDIFATYVDLGAPNGEVTVPDVGTVTIPHSGGFTWPSMAYLSTGGTRSPAEMLIFWFALDSTTARPDDYVIYRQVNGAPPEPLTRNILRDGTTPFLQYLREVDTGGGGAAIEMIPRTSLPIVHTEAVHGVTADSAGSAVADAIRAVRVTFRGTNGLAGEQERIVTASRMIDMPNAGLQLLRTCGDQPIFGVDFEATLQVAAPGDYNVLLTWPAAIDEAGGERDVAGYVVYRQGLPIAADWGDPYLSFPAGLATYSFADANTTPGETYQYAIAAQDCTPQLSTVRTSSLVAIPPA